MLIKDLVNYVGSVVEYAIVDGSKFKVKKAKVERSGAYICLHLIDKLGRENGGYINIHLSQWGDNPYFEYYTGDWNQKKVRIYPSKEAAYKYIIDKLRAQRQEINKKMLNVQMEFFRKKE